MGRGGSSREGSNRDPSLSTVESSTTLPETKQKSRGNWGKLWQPHWQECKLKQGQRLELELLELVGGAEAPLVGTVGDPRWQQLWTS